MAEESKLREDDNRHGDAQVQQMKTMNILRCKGLLSKKRETGNERGIGDEGSKVRKEGNLNTMKVRSAKQGVAVGPCSAGVSGTHGGGGSDEQHDGNRKKCSRE